MSETRSPILAKKANCRMQADREGWIIVHQLGRQQVHYSPITYSQPSEPIHTSCTFPAGTSILAPTPNVSFVGFSSFGYVTTNVPRRM